MLFDDKECDDDDDNDTDDDDDDDNHEDESDALIQVVWRLNWGHVPEKCSMSSTLLEENRAFGELTCPMAR